MGLKKNIKMWKVRYQVSKYEPRKKVIYFIVSNLYKKYIDFWENIRNQNVIEKKPYIM